MINGGSQTFNYITMTKEEIKKLEPYFVCYSEGKYLDPHGWCHNEPCRRYFHKEHSDFHFVLFTDSDIIYQIDPDGEIYGAELQTYDEFIVRFESFTREKIDNIDPKTIDVWDEADKKFDLESLIPRDDDDYEEEKHYADE